MGRIKNLAYLSVIVLAGTVMVFSMAVAYMDTYNVTGNVNIESTGTESVGNVDGGGLVGAASELATYFMGELKTDDMYVTDDLDVTDDAAIGGDITITGDTQLQDLVVGGGVYATSTHAATGVLTAANVCDYNIISITPDATAAALALTFPATSTLFADCLDTVGDVREILIINNSATAATTTTVTVPTTLIDLVGEETTSDIIAGAESGYVKFIRTGTTDMKMFVEDKIAAD